MGKDLNLQVLEQKIAKLQLENARLRARELNGSLRTYDGVVPALEAENQKLRDELDIKRGAMMLEIHRLSQENQKSFSSLREACAALEKIAAMRSAMGGIDSNGSSWECVLQNEESTIASATLATLKARHPNLGETK